MVLFSKGRFLVLNELGEQLIGGVCTLDNCYGLVSNIEIVCNSIQMPNEELWHKRMEHASYKQLSIISKNEAVLGIPKMAKFDNTVCGPCQLRKQTRTHHQATLTIATRGVHQTAKIAPKPPAKWHNRTTPQVIVHRMV